MRFRADANCRNGEPIRCPIHRVTVLTRRPVQSCVIILNAISDRRPQQGIGCGQAEELILSLFGLEFGAYVHELARDGFPSTILEALNL